MKRNTTTANAASKASKGNKKNAVNEVNAKTETPANEVSKPTEESKPKTQRVLETRQDWERIFGHAASLVNAAAKGEALTEDCRKGFSFAKVADSPNSRNYAKSLLASFASNKADKFVGDLWSQPQRFELALQVMLATKLAHDRARATKALNEVEKKQCKTFCNEVATLFKA